MKKRTLTRTLLMALALSVGLSVFAQAEEVDLPVTEPLQQIVQVEDELEQMPPAEAAQPKQQEEEPVQEQAPEEKPVFKVVFLTYDDEVLFEEQMKLGDRLAAPFFIPTRDGYMFEFWYDVKSAEETDLIEEYRFELSIKGDLTLKPHYQEIPAEEGDDADLTGEEDILPLVGPQTDTNKDATENTGTGKTDDVLMDEEEDWTNSLRIVIVDDPEPEENLEAVVKEAEEKEAVRAEKTASAESAASPIANCAIRIYSTHAECVEEGATIDLWSELIGFDNMKVALQWQYFDGEWRDVEGATSDTHMFKATKETINYGWRLLAEVLESSNA